MEFQEHEEGISIVVVCFSFLVVSHCNLWKQVRRYGYWKPRQCTSLSQKKLFTYTLLVNGVILGLRLILYLKYGKDAFVFNAKNGIIIILSLFEICSTFQVCGRHDY